MSVNAMEHQKPQIYYEWPGSTSPVTSAYPPRTPIAAAPRACHSCPPTPSSHFSSSVRRNSSVESKDKAEMTRKLITELANKLSTLSDEKRTVFLQETINRLDSESSGSN